jgi:hypothetical protein
MQRAYAVRPPRVFSSEDTVIKAPRHSFFPAFLSALLIRSLLPLTRTITTTLPPRPIFTRTLNTVRMEAIPKVQLAIQFQKHGGPLETRRDAPVVQQKDLKPGEALVKIEVSLSLLHLAWAACSLAQPRCSL